jgi:hypothetical protein
MLMAVEHSEIDLAASPPRVRLPHCKHFFLGLGSGGGVLFLCANVLLQNVLSSREHLWGNGRNQT